MVNAFVDTTILTDVLLNSGEVRRTAKEALATFDNTRLPVYAIKEFKAGPLKNVIWIHNRLQETKSYAAALRRLQSMSRTPRRYTTATALQALTNAAESIGRQTTSELLYKYGERAELDRCLCDEYRLVLKTLVKKAWYQRKNVTDEVSISLTCYREVAPSEQRGLFEYKPVKCSGPGVCCMDADLKRGSGDLVKMKEAIKEDLERSELRRCYQALRQVIRKPKRRITEEMCRALGDVIFVFYAYKDEVLLTTNTRDFKPLADSLGKRVQAPRL